MSQFVTKLLPGALCALALASSPVAMGAEAGNPAAQAQTEGTQAQNKRSLSQDDRKFVKEASGGSRAEVRLGQLAMKNAGSDEVRQFGKQMVDAHSKAAADLKDAIEGDEAQLAQDLDPKHEQALERLQKLSGEAFDREYMKMMVKEHEQDVEKFRQATEQLDDAQVKQFAEATLPKLENHLSHAREVAKTVGAS